MIHSALADAQLAVWPLKLLVVCCQPAFMLPQAPLMAASGGGSSFLRASHDASLAAQSADHPLNTASPLTAWFPIQSEVTASQPPVPTLVALADAVASHAWLVQLARLFGVQ